MTNEVCEIPVDETREQLARLRNGIVKENQLCLPVLHTRQIEGDRRKGVITHYAQAHALLDVNNKSCLTEEAEKVITASQKQIFQSLVTDNPDVIFVEGFIGKEVPLKGDLEAFFSDEIWGRIVTNGNERLVLDEYGFKTRDDAKDNIFYSFGGALVYALLYKKEILGAENPELLKKIKEELTQKFGIDELTCQKIIEGHVKFRAINMLESPLIVRDRERFALNSIKKWAGKNPGKKVALIFGSAHDFSQEYYKVFGSKGATFDRIDYPASITRLVSIGEERILKKSN